MLKDLVNQRDNLKDQIEVLVAKMVPIQAQIDLKLAPFIKEARKTKDDGTVKFAVENVLVKHTINKTVKWKTPEMEAIREKIYKAGDDPDQYMKVKEYTISKKDYSVFTKPMKKVFSVAREEKLGKPKIEFKILQGV